jgi:hypothetical protein
VKIFLIQKLITNAGITLNIGSHTGPSNTPNMGAFEE